MDYEALRRALRRSRKGRERRERILDAAEHAFGVHGYGNMSLATLATAVGITEQGAMHYFPTKTHLLLGVLERRKARDLARFSSMRRELGLSFQDLLVEVMRHNVERERALATLDAVIMAESVDPRHPAHSWFAARNEWVRAGLAGLVTRSQEAGELRTDLDPTSVAAQIIAMLDGLLLQWVLDPDASTSSRRCSSTSRDCDRRSSRRSGASSGSAAIGRAAPSRGCIELRPIDPGESCPD